METSTNLIELKIRSHYFNLWNKSVEKSPMVADMIKRYATIDNLHVTEITVESITGKTTSGQTSELFKSRLSNKE